MLQTWIPLWNCVGKCTGGERINCSVYGEVLRRISIPYTGILVYGIPGANGWHGPNGCLLVLVVGKSKQNSDKDTYRRWICPKLRYFN